MELALQGADASFARAFDQLVRLFARSPAEARPTRLYSEYGKRAADVVLEAGNLQDLRDRLEDLLMDREFMASELAAMPPSAKNRTLDDLIDLITKSELDVVSLNRAIGVAALQVCERGHRAFKVVAVTALKVVEQLRASRDAQEPAAPSPSNSPSATISDLLYAGHLPLSFRRELHKFLRATSAAFAIGRAEERAAPVAPWLGLALAEEFAKPLLKMADYIAAPKNKGQLGQRLLDGETITQQVSEMMETWRRDAVASGEGIFFPFGAIDHEDHQ